MSSPARLITATEQWFLAEGVPHFIDDVSDDGDPAVRLVAIAAAGAGVATALAGVWSDPFLIQVLTWALSGAAVVIAHVVVDLIRRQPLRHWPHRARPAELTAVVVPPFVQAIVDGGGVGRLIATVVLGGLTVWAGVFIDEFRLWRVTRWAGAQTIHQLRRVVELFGRALPLLMLFAVTLFINADVWQTASVLGAVRLWFVAAFFVLVGVAFLMLRLPGEIRAQTGPIGAEEVAAACVGTPLEGQETGWAPRAEPVELNVPQRVNLLLILMFTQILQVLLVSVMIVGFFFAFGLFAIQDNVIASWIEPELHDGQTIQSLATFYVAGQKLVITRELIRVSGFLGILSGFYFTIYVITDKTYREDFFDHVMARVRRTIVVHSAYQALRGRPVPRPAGSA